MINLDFLLNNVKSQARNLARIKRIKLNLAYEIVASAFYRCPSYNDLIRRLKDDSNKSRWFELAELHATPTDENLAKFSAALPELIDRLSSRILCSTNKEGLAQQLYEIFNLPAPADSFSSLFPGLISTDWSRVSEGQSSSNNLFESYVTLNHVKYRLLAINIFMPHYWPSLSREEQDIAEEISPQTPQDFLLQTGKPESWYGSVQEYTSKRLKKPEDFSIEFKIPAFRRLTSKERKLEQSIRKLMSISGVGDWDDIDDRPLPGVLNGRDKSSAYLIFGYPISADDNCRENVWTMPPDKCHMNDSQVFLVKSVPVTAEWISVEPETMEHQGEYFEHFECIKELLYAQSDFSRVFEKQKGANQLCFFRSASVEDLRNELAITPQFEEGMEVWFINVENCFLAEQLISKVAEGDLQIYQSRSGTRKIICKMQVGSQENKNLALSMTISGENSDRYINLTTGLCTSTEEEVCTLYITVSNSLINLIKLIGESQVLKSIKYGLINHQKEGTMSRLEDEFNSFVGCLPILSNEETEILDSMSISSGFLSSEEIWNNLRFPDYDRE